VCGRYTLVKDLAGGYRRIWESSGNEVKDLRPRYNAAPTQTMPILIPTERGVELVLAQWGYIPPWSDTRIPKISTFNAKSEGLAESRLWSAPATKPQPGLRGRCLVLCDGFYEWQKTPGGKQPLRMRRPDGELFSLAGLYGTWLDRSSGEEVLNFTIVTTEPNEFMSRIHHRMAVILDEEGERRWLDAQTPWEECVALCRPCGEDVLVSEKVSTLVNSVKNDVAECVELVA
jgi:putative SOS response-associated peptidase YedK